VCIEPSIASNDPEPTRRQEWFGTTTALTSLFSLLLQQSYPALYALLVTLALGLGGAIAASQLRRGSPDDPADSGRQTR
jgi:hypothetical protein